MAEENVLSEFERDESLVIPVTMTKEDLRATISGAAARWLASQYSFL